MTETEQGGVDRGAEKQLERAERSRGGSRLQLITTHSVATEARPSSKAWL